MVRKCKEELVVPSPTCLIASFNFDKSVGSFLAIPNNFISTSAEIVTVVLIDKVNAEKSEVHRAFVPTVDIGTEGILTFLFRDWNTLGEYVGVGARHTCHQQRNYVSGLSRCGVVEKRVVKLYVNAALECAVVAEGVAAERVVV